MSGVSVAARGDVWARGRDPVVVAALVVAAAWVALLVQHGGMAHESASQAAQGSATTASTHAGCDMPMDMPGRPATSGPVADHDGPALGLPALGWWLLMTVAMMGPGALAGVDHVSRNSLLWRRGRAALEYAGGYLSVWTLTGLAVVTLFVTVPRTSGVTALTVLLGAAAAWQLTPWKRRCLRACHRSIPLPPRGWPAERASLVLGWRNGAGCVGSCWWLMLAMVAAPTGHLLLSAGLTVAVTAEKVAPRPRSATRLVAAGLVVTAVAVVVAGLVGG